MQTSTLEYRDGDTLLEAWVARPTTEAMLRPAVLVCHAWGGRSEFECRKAEQLASLGYVGIALDNYGKGVRGRDNDESAALMTPFIQDRAMLRQRLLAGLAAARRGEFPWSVQRAGATAERGTDQGQGAGPAWPR
jgi:dienelactone hydrolase